MRGNPDRPVFVRQRIFLLTLWLLAVCLGDGACTGDPHPEVVRAFSDFIDYVQLGDLEKMDAVCHPGSPFFHGRPDPAHRVNFWRIQRLRLTMAGGKIDILESTAVDEKRVCRYRLTPSSRLYSPVESTVTFARDQGKWKAWIPETDFELTPIDFSDVRFEQTKSYDLGDGNRLNMEMVVAPDGAGTKAHPPASGELSGQ